MKILLFLLTCVSLYAQNSGRVEYMHVTRTSIDYKTTAVFEFNSEVSKYRVLKHNQSPKEITSTFEDNNLTVFMPESKFRPEYFVDRSSNMLLSYKYMFKKNNLLKEAIPKIDWKIKDEFKLLNTIKCQKAIGYFRGRTYSVWFANDIPVPYGPWKLQGLPGVILEAQDDKSEIFFKATKVTLQDMNDIELPDIKKAISLKEFITVVIPEKNEELAAFMNSKQADRNTTVSAFKPNRNTFKEII